MATSSYGPTFTWPPETASSTRTRYFLAFQSGYPVVYQAYANQERPSFCKNEGLLMQSDREVEARAGIEPACKDLQSSA